MAKDPDAPIVALFKHHAIKNEGRSIKEGRPIYDDMEICEIRFAGSRNVSVFPALAFSHWTIDPETQEQIAVTYAERFQRQYRQFKEHTMQTKSGTPLAQVPFLTEARRAELRALNIYTIEALAQVDGQELKNLGSYGRDLKNKAIEFIADAKVGAPTAEMMAELEALRARNQILEEDNKLMATATEKDDVKTGGPFDHMSVDMLRDFIKTNTGHMPHGSLNRKTLVRMATEAQQKVD
jgi:hypothetical protein